MKPDATRAFVHRFVPSTAIPPSPLTLLMLHGTGGDEDDLLPLGKSLDGNAALLSPRGRVLENGAPRFFRRLAEGVFDLPDLHRRTDELAEFIQASIEAYAIDPGRIVAVGYSNGANIAASLLLTHPAVLAGAILFRPMVPFEPEQPPTLSHIPILICGGNRDPIATPAQTSRLATLLRSGGAQVDVSHELAGHELMQGDIVKARQWLALHWPTA